MSNDLNSALARVVAIGKEALTSIGITADGVAYFLHTQEDFPYFTVRVSNDEVAGESTDFDEDTYTIILRLVIGHVTEGYAGQPEDMLYDAIPVIKTYLNQQELLQSAAYPTALNSLVQARCTNCLGFRIFQNAGIAAQQVGTEFTIVCEFNETITQSYL